MEIGKKLTFAQDELCLNKSKQREIEVETKKYNNPDEMLKDANRIARMLLACCSGCIKANEADTCPYSPVIIETRTVNK